MNNLEEKLTDMRNDGRSYSYIDGYEDGYTADTGSVGDLSDYLSELRDSGEDYDYIQGFEDGYED